MTHNVTNLRYQTEDGDVRIAKFQSKRDAEKFADLWPHSCAVVTTTESVDQVF